jgi:uracil-DNA glycosylase
VNIEQQLGAEWYKLLGHLFKKDASIYNLGFILHRTGNRLTPSVDEMFRAYQLCQPSQLRVLILGQDPYPSQGIADGLAFSCKNGVVPSSLRIVFKELERCGYGKRTSPNLSDWARQGVMLLNTVLTTEVGVTFAHKNMGWERFTAATLKIINKLPQKYTVLSWGRPSQDMIDMYIEETEDHKIFRACHPQYEVYSGGKTKFTGCGHFEKSNNFLDQPIKWV